VVVAYKASTHINYRWMTIKLILPLSSEYNNRQAAKEIARMSLNQNNKARA